MSCFVYPPALSTISCQQSVHWCANASRMTLTTSGRIAALQTTLSLRCEKALLACMLSDGFSFPYGVAVDGTGNSYVADSDNNRLVVLVRLNTCPLMSSWSSLPISSPLSSSVINLVIIVVVFILNPCLCP